MAEDSNLVSIPEEIIMNKIYLIKEQLGSALAERGCGKD
jgi:hypothetical protein